MVRYGLFSLSLFGFVLKFAPGRCGSLGDLVLGGTFVFARFRCAFLRDVLVFFPFSTSWVDESEFLGHTNLKSCIFCTDECTQPRETVF